MIKEKEKRDFYEKECVNSKWVVRELKRQVKSSLYERILLSNGKVNIVIFCYDNFYKKC